MNKNPAMTSYQRRRGFTLIELMITLAIMGILAGIAYPAYNSYLIKASRAAAKSFMMSVSSRQEEYLLDARQYAPIASHTEFSTTLSLPVPKDVSDYYDVTVETATPRSFMIQAQPKAGTRQANDGSLKVYNTGVKEPADKW